MRYPAYQGMELVKSSARGQDQPHQPVILLVDDEDTVRRLTATVLERAGYSVVQAGGGSEALQTISTPQRIDLLMTDIVMPEMNGLVLAGRVHQLRPGLPVLFMSGFADRFSQELSGSVCLRKPFTAAALVTAVADLLPRARHA